MATTHRMKIWIIYNQILAGIKELQKNIAYFFAFAAGRGILRQILTNSSCIIISVQFYNYVKCLEKCVTHLFVQLPKDKIPQGFCLNATDTV